MPRLHTGVVLLATMVGSGGARAQPEVETSAPTAPRTELENLQLRYGMDFHQGGQSDTGPGLTYSGSTTDDVSLRAAWFGDHFWGAILDLGREGFRLTDPTGTASTLVESEFRGFLGPGARVLLGPFYLEGAAGYGLAELPSFANSGNPTWAPAYRHSLSVAARARLWLPFDLFLEARGLYPFTLAVQGGPGGKASSSGLTVGARLGIQLGNWERMNYGLALDYQYESDSLTTTGQATSWQKLSQAGVVLELAWMDAAPAPPPPKYGGVLVAVLDNETGAPIPQVPLVLSHRGDEYRLVAGSDGTAIQPKLKAGTLVARAAPDGYVPAEGKADVVLGQDVRVEVRVQKKVGSLLVTVVEQEGQQPMAQIPVTIKGTLYRTDDAGRVAVKDMSPGLVKVAAKAPSYRDQDEVASIVVGKQTALTVTMVKTKKKLAAVITGRIRSTAGGTPLAATLQIPEVKLETRAEDDGTFTIQLDAGTYRVVISAEGYRTQTKSLKVREAEKAIFNIDLYPANQ